MEKDVFGNTIVRAHTHIQRAIDATPAGKAIILYGMSDEQVGRELYVGTTKDGRDVHILPNHSNGPRLYNGKVYAAGVCVLVQDSLDREQYAAVFVKDKTKPVLTCLGGTYNPHSETHREAAIREVKEETRGTAVVGRKSTSLAGLDLESTQLEFVASVTFRSSYYGIEDIPDVYHLHSVVVPIGDPIIVLLSLVESNTLRYSEEHEETEFLRLIPLHSELLHNVGALLNVIPKDVSPLHWVLAHATLARVLKIPFTIPPEQSFRRVREITLHT